MAQIMSGKTLINLAENRAAFTAKEFQEILTRNAYRFTVAGVDPEDALVERMRRSVA